MKLQTILAGILLTIIPASLKAQVNSAPENPHMCGQHTQYARMLAENPQLYIQDSIDQANFDIAYQNYLADYDPHQRSTYTIPTVIHVVHLNGPENISDEQIHDALRTLNEDFNMLNSDLGNTVAAFSGIIGNPSFEFKLATKDPNGNCHSGITRTVSASTYDTGYSFQTNSQAIVEAVANEHGVWPQNEYMSVFVCIDPSGNAGYTYRPSNAFNSNQMYGAIFMRHDYMGTIGTGSLGRRHTLAHEAGHWLNLAHLWGNSNNPGIATNCNGDDGVGDTPNTIGWQTCALQGVTCGSLDNVQNIMEYSFCSTMFTQGQAARMHTAINNSVGGRNNLITNANLSATGVLVPSNDICEARFTSTRQILCQGESIDFSDLSVHNVNNRNWTFTGGSPASSGDSVVNVTYNSPGNYSVTLQVSNASANETTTITNYITVLSVPGSGFPYSEGFENKPNNFLNNNEDFSTFNQQQDNTWALANVGSNSSRSAYIANYDADNSDLDRLISGTIDLSVLPPSSDLEFTFDYAYNKKASSDLEYLKVFVSNDCGESWALRKILSGNFLSSDVTPGNFVPSASDWQTVTLTNISSSFYTGNFRYMFQFESANGNNIYIDNINISSPNFSSVDEQIETNRGISVYPNPTLNQSTISLTGYDNSNVDINVYDIMGKAVINVHSGLILTDHYTNSINLENLSQGLYFIKVSSTDNSIGETIKLIKE